MPKTEISSLSQSSIKTVNEVKAGIRNMPAVMTDWGYTTSLELYGFTLREAADGATIFDPHGIKNRIDQIGDRLIRAGDDAVLQRPGRLVFGHIDTTPHDPFMQSSKRRFIPGHPMLALKAMTAEAKRYRNVKHVQETVQRLGLTRWYGEHPEGIAVLQPAMFRRYMNLQDIYRVDAEILQKVDRNQALFQAGRYIRELHARGGAIGELHVSDIFFQDVLDREHETVVENPVLGLPDIVYNPKRYSPEALKTRTEPRAVDVLDFVMNIAAEEYKKTHNWDNVVNGIQAFYAGYADTKVIHAVGILAKKGRETIAGDAATLDLPNTITTRLRTLFTFHNTARLGVPAEIATDIRKAIILQSQQAIH